MTDNLSVDFEIFGLKDVKSGVFMPPLLFRNKAEAIRNITYLVKNEQIGDVGKFPGDFQLWYLGLFDVNTGKIVPSQDFVIDVSALLG